MKKVITLIIFIFLLSGLLLGEELTEKDYLEYDNQGMEYYKEKKYKEAIEIWNKIPESSLYYSKAQGYIQKAKERNYLESGRKLDIEKKNKEDIEMYKKINKNNKY